MLNIAIIEEERRRRRERHYERPALHLPLCPPRPIEDVERDDDDDDDERGVIIIDLT